jgi:hypothetical protein
LLCLAQLGSRVKLPLRFGWIYFPYFPAVLWLSQSLKRSVTDHRSVIVNSPYLITSFLICFSFEEPSYRSLWSHCSLQSYSVLSFAVRLSLSFALKFICYSNLRHL